MPVDLERRARFEALFERHHSAVRGYVVRRAAGVVVEDVVAETFLVAWRRLEDVPELALPWLLGVARRVSADQRRAARRRRSLSERLRQEASTPGSWSPPVGLSPELVDALRMLTEREREALLLVAWDGLSPRDAAVVAGCSSAAFRVRLHRARVRVCTQLGIDQDTPNITETLA
jgi:RNA polymerase sigma-70 factor (ECF subfamily)